MNTMQFCHYTTITQQYVCVETKNIFGIVNLLYMQPCVVEIIRSVMLYIVYKQSWQIQSYSSAACIWFIVAHALAKYSSDN